MDRPLGVDDVLGGPTPWPALLRRGLRRRCPRCGAGDVFRTRYRLVDRCPGCGYRFEREPGFFLGAWFLNFMLVELVHFVLVMAFIVWKATHPDAGLLAPLALGVGLGIALPIICYPWSQTVWAAMDLGMTPLELQEIVDAADSLAGGHDDGPVGADDPSAAPEERDGRPDQ